jgi:hypothetical protein
MNREKLRIGIIGYNDGNGHPYSFSAIVNGYDKSQMQNCPYPVINDYLSKRNDDEFGVPNLKVTHVWTPYIKISKSIASCCYINNVCDKYEDMVDEIDAVIIARDDASSHKPIASFFLNNNKKVFVDKPLCDNIEDLNYFLPFVKRSQLMTASGLRFHPDLENQVVISEVFKYAISAHAIIPIEWFKYGIHALEPLSLIFTSSIKSVQNFGNESYDLVKIIFSDNRYAIVERNPKIKNGIFIDLYTSSASKYTLMFKDNFVYFKRLLYEFRDFILNNKVIISDNAIDNLIRGLVAGNLSLQFGNKKISVDEL